MTFTRCPTADVRSALLLSTGRAVTATRILELLPDAIQAALVSAWSLTYLRGQAAHGAVAVACGHWIIRFYAAGHRAP